jgi:hypothetical protein
MKKERKDPGFITGRKEYKMRDSYFIYKENYYHPGESYFYDFREDPRQLSEEDANTSDERGPFIRLKLLESLEED